MSKKITIQLLIDSLLILTIAVLVIIIRNSCEKNKCEWKTGSLYSCFGFDYSHYKTFNKNFLSDIVVFVIRVEDLDEDVGPPQDYSHLFNRILSFLNRPFHSNQINPKILAEDGYYYTERGNLLCCSSCGYSLGCLNLTENINFSHDRYRPRCPLAVSRASNSPANLAEGDDRSNDLSTVGASSSIQPVQESGNACVCESLFSPATSVRENSNVITNNYSAITAMLTGQELGAVSTDEADDRSNDLSTVGASSSIQSVQKSGIASVCESLLPQENEGSNNNTEPTQE